MLENIFIVIYFLVFVTTIASALIVVLSRNTLFSALALIVTMCMLAVNFLMMKAEFVALVQLLVYAGAIMVLFLFVIMLLNLKRGEPFSYAAIPRRSAGLLLALFFAAQASYIAWYFFNIESVTDQLATTNDPSTIHDLAASMMTRYLVPFELTSILLLAAVIGALTIGMSAPRKD